jgi:hypothetical protein
VLVSHILVQSWIKLPSGFDSTYIETQTRELNQLALQNSITKSKSITILEDAHFEVDPQFLRRLVVAHCDAGSDGVADAAVHKHVLPGADLQLLLGPAKERVVGAYERVFQHMDGCGLAREYDNR